jgi:hypothetical protein
VAQHTRIASEAGRGTTYQFPAQASKYIFFMSGSAALARAARYKLSRSGAWLALRGRTIPRTRSIDAMRSDRFRSTFSFQSTRTVGRGQGIAGPQARMRETHATAPAPPAIRLGCHVRRQDRRSPVK